MRKNTELLKKDLKKLTEQINFEIDKQKRKLLKQEREEILYKITRRRK